jgi:hypothetical protein
VSEDKAGAEGLSAKHEMIRSVITSTLGPAYVTARRWFTRLAFERPSGIHTTPVALEELGLAAPDRVDHEPAGWLTLRRILRRREVAPGDVFIDFGSGMGRVIYQAAKYPFKRIIGVELSRELTEIARLNMQTARKHLRCTDIELVTCDAQDYSVPDDITIAFFNNPFRGRVFADVVGKLVASVEAHPRVLRVIYYNPVEEATLLDHGAILVRKRRGWRPTREWSRAASIHMYELRPRDSTDNQRHPKHFRRH